MNGRNITEKFIKINDRIKMTDTLRINKLGGQFIGDKKILVAILNPHVANWFMTKTRRLRRLRRVNEKYICSNAKCTQGTISHLEAAHPIGKERPLIIKDAIDALYPNGTNSYDIKMVLDKTKSIHENLLFAFLCRPCHQKHGDNSNEIIESKTLAEWSKAGGNPTRHQDSFDE